jgi:hypothetical protein
MNQIEQLKLRLLNKKNQPVFETLVGLHELFIKEYGWVPLEEFRQIPAETLFNLVAAAERRMKREKKKMKRVRKPRSH